MRINYPVQNFYIYITIMKTSPTKKSSQSTLLLLSSTNMRQSPIDNRNQIDSSSLEINLSSCQRYNILRLSDRTANELKRWTQNTRTAFDTKLMETHRTMKSTLLPDSPTSGDIQSPSEETSLSGITSTAKANMQQQVTYAQYTYGYPETRQWNAFRQTVKSANDDSTSVVILYTNQGPVHVSRSLLRMHSLSRVKDQPMDQVNLTDCSLSAVQLTVYALITGRLHLTLNTALEVFRVCAHLRLNRLLLFFDRLFRSSDLLCLLLRIRQRFGGESFEDQFSIVTENDQLLVPPSDCELLNEATIRLNEILQFGGSLDLTLNELFFVLQARPDTSRHLQAPTRCEFTILRFVFDWWAQDRVGREEAMLHVLRLLQPDRIALTQLPAAMNVIMNVSCAPKLSAALTRLNNQLIRLAVRQLPIDQFFMPPMVKSEEITNADKRTTQIKLTTTNAYGSSICQSNDEDSLIDDHSQNAHEYQSISISRPQSSDESSASSSSPSPSSSSAVHSLVQLLRNGKLCQTIGSRALSSTHATVYTTGDASCLLMFGGFGSQIPYLSDQGKVMYHMRALNDRSESFYSILHNPSESSPSTDVLHEKLDAKTSTIRHKHVVEPSRQLQVSNTMDAREQRSLPDDVALFPNTLTHEWLTLMERLPRNLAHFAHVQLGRYVLIIGGLDLSSMFTKRHAKHVRPLADCYCFDTLCSCWYRMRPMKSARAFHAACMWNNRHVYVFGGLTLNGNGAIEMSATMEQFDLSTGNWSYVSPLQVTDRSNRDWPVARMAFGMQPLSNWVYVFGGIGEVDATLNFRPASVLNDVWAFDPNSNQFKRCVSCDLDRPRAAFATVQLIDSLWLIGGIEACHTDELLPLQKPDSNGNMVAANAVRVTAHVLTLNIKCKWRHQCPLQQPRIFCSAVRSGRWVVVVGGKTTPHLFLGAENLSAFCGSYELLHDQQPTRWIEVPIMFSVYGAGIARL